MTNGALLFLFDPACPSSSLFHSTGRKRKREIARESGKERERGSESVYGLCAIHVQMAVIDVAQTNKQIHQDTCTCTGTRTHAHTHLQIHTNNYGSRSTLTSFCELTGHLYTGEIKDIRHIQYIQL